MHPSAPQLPEIELEPGTVVIADLHLDVGPGSPEERRFERFVQAQTGAPRLVVLGDLFDAWVGPAQMDLPAAKRVVESLRALTRSGTRVELLVGNRDFLLERRFEEATGARVHPNGFVGVVAGRRALFVHGDELCTLDHGYQRLKRVLRSGLVLWTAPRLPRAVALWAARRLRASSVRAVGAKPPSEKEQQRGEVERLAARSGCEMVVCGHAHEFRYEVLGGERVRWFVLGAFGGGRDVMRVGAGGEIDVGDAGSG